MSNTTTSHQPFFIVGAQRSGTTLLRLILNAHSEIAIPEEARFLMPLLKESNINKPLSGKQLENTINYLKQDQQYKQWNYDSEPTLKSLASQNQVTIHDLIHTLYQSFAEHEGKTSWADKSLFFRKIDLLAKIFPEAKFIHLVRDGRDVFHSWRKMDKLKDNVVATAIDWNYKLKRINNSFERLPENRHITLKYEDLLEEPEETVKKLCNFLGIDFQNNMMNYHQTSHYYIGEHHSELIFKNIDSSNKYKWRKNMTTTEINAFELICKNNLKKYNYDLSGNNYSMTDYVYIISRLITGVPYRVFTVIRQKLLADKALKHGETHNKDTGTMPELKK